MMTRRPVNQYTGLLFFLITVSLSAPQAGAQEGFALTGDGLVVDLAAQWEQWRRPKHAVYIDPVTHIVTPRRISRGTNAILDINGFQTLIGNKKAYDKLVKELGLGGVNQ